MLFQMTLWKGKEKTNHISKGKPVIKAAAPSEPPNSNSSDSPFMPMPCFGPEAWVGTESFRFLSVAPIVVVVDIDVGINVDDVDDDDDVEVSHSSLLC